MKTIVGLFDDFSHAQNAVQELTDAGIPRNDISLVANNAGGQYDQYATPETTPVDDTAQAAGTGATTGGVIGGVTGLLMGLGLFIIPGFGPIAAAGWLVSTITGAGIGALAGGLIGALTHVGVSETDAALYSEGVRRGGTLLAVRAEDNNANAVANILSDNGAVNIDERATTYQQEGFLPTTNTPQTAATAPIATPAAANTMAANMNTNTPVARDLKQGEVALPVVEEEMQVGKRQVERGGVRVYSHMTEKPVEENVQLREEHVTVERRPVDRPVSQADMAAFKEGSIEVTETAEEPVIAKQARVVEEVIVGKEATQRTETVHDTVRRTDVEVEKIPGSEHVSRTASWDGYANNFRTNWQTTYGNMGGRYEDYEPAYRYGYDLANNPTYRGQNWNTMESNIQRDWNTRYPNTWDRFKNSIRYAWDQTTGVGNGVPGIQTGGRAMDGTPDTRGMTEKVADTLTGDRIDDKTGKVV